ncbi:kinase-like protein [Xylona heveae TC161]|uniref:Kinase-like protein n=1 Tax=Xylona heveae (strain CBS 132557 / TC161) TaxID=1328760 RepID=A0A165AGW8_XYLHT|nr:kinase-like protein [Xylona heveae TC161]KZF20451.1 kinase-like protein [Xylona heveae TC161]
MSLEDDPTLPVIERKDLGNFISLGITGFVYLMNEHQVAKLAKKFEDCAYSDNASLNDIQIEREVYKRLGSHPRICKFISSINRGIVLERLGVQLRRRLYDLRGQGERPSYAQSLLWSCQVTEGVAHVHRKGVVQGDLGCHNILLDKDDNLKLTDFAGSAYDGNRPIVGPERRSRTEPFHYATVETEIFALGSVIYEIWTTNAPYRDETDEVVEERFKNKQYADVNHLPVGNIIRGCWHGTYATADDVLADLESLPKAEPHKQSADILDTLGRSQRALILLASTMAASYFLMRWLRSQ